MMAFSENSSNLRDISLLDCNFGNRGVATLTATLANCSGLRYVNLQLCDIGDEVLAKLATSFRELVQLEAIDLSSNHIGSGGCESLAGILKHANSILRIIALDRNDVDDKGAIALANALVGNTELEELHLDRNNSITTVGWDAFSQVLCNTSSINATYCSNHTLQRLEEFECEVVPNEVSCLLDMNCNCNKRDVAMKKILRLHRHFDMKPFFELGLKVLPIAVGWLVRAGANESAGNNGIDFGGRMLSIFFQFARAMPMQFVPVVH